MEEIVNAVKRVTDIMSEIAAASNEQSSGIEQVNQAIAQMDEVTQQNAALVEEAAAAAESMKEQANALYAAVSVFKMNKAKGSAQIAVASPEIALPVAGGLASLRNERRMSGQPKQRRMVKAKEEYEKHLSGHPKDGEWKEF